MEIFLPLPRGKQGRSKALLGKGRGLPCAKGLVGLFSTAGPKCCRWHAGQDIYAIIACMSSRNLGQVLTPSIPSCWELCRIPHLQEAQEPVVAVAYFAPTSSSVLPPASSFLAFPRNRRLRKRDMWIPAKQRSSKCYLMPHYIPLAILPPLLSSSCSLWRRGGYAAAIPHSSSLQPSLMYWQDLTSSCWGLSPVGSRSVKEQHIMVFRQQLATTKCRGIQN